MPKKSYEDLIEEIIYEGFGPNGVAIIVETMTDNKNRSAAEVRSTFSKYNGNLGVSGCVKHNFKKQLNCDLTIWSTLFFKTLFYANTTKNNFGNCMDSFLIFVGR